MISVSVSAIAEDTLVMIYRNGIKFTASSLRSAKALGFSFCSFSRAYPTPYHPVRKNLAWLQLKTQGIALRSPNDRFPVRLAGREPMLLDSITSIGVAWEKNFTKSSV